MIAGYVSSAVLAASGLAGVLVPGRIAEVLETPLPTGRAAAEMRVAYAAFGGLGVWALATGHASAVGVAWFAAAGVRVLALPVDRPRSSWTYWAFLVLEVTLGLAGVLGEG